ncbi:hypothetical protein BDZ45DRAFT_544810, partial [Acephala macrosclerotiorum]
LHQLDRFVFNECYTVLNSTIEFWSKMRQLDELIEKGEQMIYLMTILPLHAELEFINIIKIRVENVHIFRVSISRSNIAYSVAEYEKNKFEKEDIIAVCRLIEEKLKEYFALTKIIIYSSSIVTTQKVNNTLNYHAYY